MSMENENQYLLQGVPKIASEVILQEKEVKIKCNMREHSFQLQFELFSAQRRIEMSWKCPDQKQILKNVLLSSLFPATYFRDRLVIYGSIKKFCLDQSQHTVVLSTVL